MPGENTPSTPSTTAAPAITGAAPVSHPASVGRPSHVPNDPVLQSRAAFMKAQAEAPLPAPPDPVPAESLSKPQQPVSPTPAASATAISSAAKSDAIPASGEGQRPAALASSPFAPAPAAAPSSVMAQADVEDEEPALELPPLDDAQLRFLTSPHYKESERVLKLTFALTDDDLQFLNEMDHAVMTGVIDIPQYIAALRGEFTNLNNDEKMKLIGTVIAFRFVPFGKAFSPSAEDAAKKESISFPPVPYYQVYKKPMTFGGAAHEVARMVGIPLMGQAQERLRDLLVSKLKGVRIDAQVEDQLARSSDFGGIGLSKDKAKAAVDAMNDILGRAMIMAEEEYSRWLSSEIRHKQAVEHPDVVEKVAPKEAVEDEKEIARITATMPRPEKDTSSALYTSVRATMKDVTHKPTDAYLERRLENIISTRLRDVRSRNEVLMKLMRDVKVGGLGYGREDADETADQIEAGYAKFRDVIAKEEKTKIEQQLTDQEKKIGERRSREAEEHARWYEEKIKSKRVEEEDKRQMLSRMKVIAQGYTTPIPHPVDLKEQAKERTSFGELVPAGTMTALPPSAASALVRPAAPVPGMKKEEAPSRKLSEKPVVKVSAATAKLQSKTQAGRPKLADVQQVQRGLAGPLQEISSMTLDQFRRISADPSAAAARIKDKVELLAQESFTKRVQGVQAWQQSPLQQQYLRLLTEAFTAGKPVNELVKTKRAAGGNVLSPEELSAIIELNNQIRM